MGGFEVVPEPVTMRLPGRRLLIAFAVCAGAMGLLHPGYWANRLPVLLWAVAALVWGLSLVTLTALLLETRRDRVLGILVVALWLALLVYPAQWTYRLEKLAGPEPTPYSWIGRKLPDLELRDAQGRTLRLSELRGKVVLVDFSAQWVGAESRPSPDLCFAHRRLSAEGLVVLGVRHRPAGPDPREPFPYPLLTVQGTPPEPWPTLFITTSRVLVDREGALGEFHRLHSLDGLHTIARDVRGPDWKPGLDPLLVPPGGNP